MSFKREKPTIYSRLCDKLPYLGNGGFSTVFSLPKHPDLVLKYGNWASDDWPRWALWCAEHGYAGNFGPKVYSIKTLYGSYLAVMERLEECRDMIAEQAHFQMRQAVSRFNSDRSRLAPALDKFGQACIDAGWINDCAGRNIMMRGDTPVLTDPQNAYRENLKTEIGSWQRRTMLIEEAVAPLREMLAA